MKILWIAFVWPEPGSSAAGLRTLQLLRICKEANYEVRVASPCQANEHKARLEEEGFECEIFAPNDSCFDSFVADYSPDIVFFDRFMVEEQFSWRVKEQCPEALRVLDTIDLHSLRRAREAKFNKGEVPLNLTDSELHSEAAIREIASIYRSDLSLLISEAELSLLKDRYNVEESLLAHLRFFFKCREVIPTFDERKNFVTIGNFNHPPNMDSFKYLHKELWKLIRKNLHDAGIPNAELHIYGAYPTKELMDLDDPASGFRVKGWAKDSIETLSEYRVNLAPLRFGAGIKGKILDGWSSGTPVAATQIAAEAMSGALEFGGIVAEDKDAFAKAAADLYLSDSEWSRASVSGLKIIKELYSENTITKNFLGILTKLIENKERLRESNFAGKMLWHHQHRSTEYFSRWIEEKNKG